MINYNFTHYDSLDSTNSEVKRLCQQDYPEGTVVVAATQTVGRGRLGRRWISPPGNLYFSILLRPKVSLDVLSQLALVGGLALAKTIKYYMGDTCRVTLKWPNDILVNLQKIAGILIETDMDSCLIEGTPCYLGIGVNMERAPELTAYPAIAFKDFVTPIPDTAEFLNNFVINFNSMYVTWQEEGFVVLRDEWLSFAHGLGEFIVATAGKEGQIEGEFLTITEAGSLILLDENEKEHIISSSEVTFPDIEDRLGFINKN
ncbi:biotin--[acetyl-CoA-carboxylase] ligase [Candidatus Paracaedibacter symbiosus]|uniref:biotin--[acetyl-CoA-carboxylase] ligase n=1 Tax=Candidatus Paracaedibacter symbiosus TaxID=244582 RepID=UPI0005098E1B|nr:biotin--[acetyl-CoA-carboxylase] ligase [Candidatus Paracaedibacter symbiosus]